MSGNHEGARKTKEMLLNNNPQYYEELSKAGAKASRGGRAAKDPEYAREIGRQGGIASGKARRARSKARRANEAD